MIEKRNNHALKCIQIETQLIYANLEAFVYILSGLGNIQSQVSSDVSLDRIELLEFLFLLPGKKAADDLEIVFDENLSTWSNLCQYKIVDCCWFEDELNANDVFLLLDLFRRKIDHFRCSIVRIRIESIENERDQAREEFAVVAVGRSIPNEIIRDVLLEIISDVLNQYVV